jgi:hypothetical protein
LNKKANYSVGMVFAICFATPQECNEIFCGKSKNYQEK